MKTAVSIPDELFEAADRLAEREGVSRSEFYARALRRYVESISGEEVTASYARLAQAVDTALPANVRKATADRLRKIEW